MGAAVTAGIVLFAGACAAAAARALVRRRMLDRIAQPPAASAPGSFPTMLARRRLRTAAIGIPVLIAGYAVLGPPGAVIGAAAVVALPAVVRRRRARRESEAMHDGLSDAVAGIAAGLRAGLSLSQALRLAVGDCEPALAAAMREVSLREDLGVPLDESLDRWARSSRSDDVRLVAGVLRLRVGAGHPRVLDEVRRALRQRRQSRREVRSLTAQARLSGTILGVLPLGFFAFLWLTSRHDMAAAYGTPAGLAAIVVGLVLQGGAFLWIRTLVRAGAS